MPKVSAIVVAGGSSTRMGGIDKLFFPLGGMTVLERTFSVLNSCPLITEIVAVTVRDSIERTAQLASRYPKVSQIVEGGRTRFDSVQIGVSHCDPYTQYYAIHDAARPFVSERLVSDVIRKAIEVGGAAPALPVTDTIKEVREDGYIQRTPDRTILYAVETPQVFSAEKYRQAAEGQTGAFDDCQLFERAGYSVAVLPGEATNIKITRPEDIEIAKQIAGVTDMRVGHGYDAHRLVEGRKLMLGGVSIPYEKGLDGHSDADVLIHAVMDALLGASSMGDIGQYFPDTDERYKDGSSMQMLKEIVRVLLDRHFVIGNLDATLVCQQPKLAPYLEKMKGNIALTLGIEAHRVGLKATTEEGMGFTGEGLGIAAHAVVIIRQKLL